MKAFSWKRKTKVLNDSNTNASAFGPVAESNPYELDPGVDWLTATKRKKVLHLEDTSTKAKRLRDEGTFLADKDRWWEAIGRYHSSLSLEPDNYMVRDMMAQSYMQVCEVFQAVKEAKIVTTSNPLWWAGHQTLGRAYMGIGEVAMAVKSFSRAVHIHPQSKELRKEDLQWAYKLLKEHNRLQEEKEVEKLKEEQEESFMIMEIPEDIEIETEKDFDKFIGKDKEPLAAERPTENAAETKKSRQEPPITCCSRKGFKRKVACADARFNKPVAALNQSGHVMLSSREKIKLEEMICFRS